MSESQAGRNKSFRAFRLIAIAEGISFLVLLIIAMPLKYMANYPMAVTIVGGIHGFLFLAFIAMAWVVKNNFQKSWTWFAKAFFASIIPAGTLVMDREWKKELVIKSNSQ